MRNQVSRRKFLGAASAVALMPDTWGSVNAAPSTNNDPSAFIKIVFGSDTDLALVESVVNQYRAMFDACDVPERTRKMIMGGTLSRMLGLPD